MLAITLLVTSNVSWTKDPATVETFAIIARKTVLAATSAILNQDSTESQTLLEQYEYSRLINRPISMSYEVECAGIMPSKQNNGTAAAASTPVSCSAFRDIVTEVLGYWVACLGDEDVTVHPVAEGESADIVFEFRRVRTGSHRYSNQDKATGKFKLHVQLDKYKIRCSTQSCIRQLYRLVMYEMARVFGLYRSSNRESLLYFDRQPVQSTTPSSSTDLAAAAAMTTTESPKSFYASGFLNVNDCMALMLKEVLDPVLPAPASPIIVPQLAPVPRQAKELTAEGFLIIEPLPTSTTAAALTTVAEEGSGGGDEKIQNSSYSS